MYLSLYNLHTFQVQPIFHLTLALKEHGSQKEISKKKTAPKKKVAPKKKAAPKKKVAPKKKAAPKKKVAPKKKTAPKKKVVPKKKAAPKKKVVPKKKVAPKKKAAPKKKVTSEKTKAIKKTRRIVSSDKPEFTPYKIKKNEDYMNDTQIEHFRSILNEWKTQLLEEINRTVTHMQENASNFADPADLATQEEEFALELRTRDRERKLLRKINAALARIDDGTYGYCEETGEEIGILRLEARPVATLCVEAQERHEIRKRQFRDIEDRNR